MTTADPAFRIPDDVRELLPTHLHGYELPADPTHAQIIAAWDMQTKLDAEAGNWLRTSLIEPTSDTFYLDGARKIAAVSALLVAAIRAVNPAVNFKG